MVNKIFSFCAVLAFAAWFFLPQILPNKHSQNIAEVSPAASLYYHVKASVSCDYRGMAAGYSSRDKCVEKLARTWEYLPSYDPRDDITTAAFHSTDPALLKQRANFINSKGIEIEGWTAKDYEKRRQSLLNDEGY